MNRFIWIVIPVHNRKEMTKACLESLIRQDFRNYHILVVDDGSTDGTEEMITNHFPQVCILKGDGNYFWTRATNLGVQEALKKADTQDFVLTLNNDLTADRSDYLDQLIRCATDHPRSLIGSISLDSMDKEKILDGGVRIHWGSARFEQLESGKSYRSLLAKGLRTQDVDALPGRGTLIPTEVFKDIGLYNERLLPHYAADYEFSIRAKRNGYALLINYHAVIRSDAAASGLNNAVRHLRWKDYFKSFTSIRSPNNLYYRWNFSKLCCPGFKGLVFYMLDACRVIFGSLRDQIFQKAR